MAAWAILSGTTVICLTPVRNEAWILERFLAAASCWADHIVIADQGSVDGSRAIAEAHPKAIVVDNPSPAYDERARQELLLRTARDVTDGRRLLIALDADEALSATAFEGLEWKAALAAAPGTVMRWRWANVMPGGREVWIPDAPLIFGLLDDGRAHGGDRIHNVRLPLPPDAPIIDFDESVVLHLQYVDWTRMKSKQTWYQCWETLQDPHKRPAALYRQYHHMDSIPPEDLRPFDPRWTAEYEAAGIDLLQLAETGATWWDAEILDWLQEHGPERFAKVDVWGLDWAERAHTLGREVAPASVDDPRGPLDRAVSRWLAATQRRREAPWVRFADRGLRILGW